MERTQSRKRQKRKDLPQTPPDPWPGKPVRETQWAGLYGHNVSRDAGLDGVIETARERKVREYLYRRSLRPQRDSVLRRLDVLSDDERWTVLLWKRIYGNASLTSIWEHTTALGLTHCQYPSFQQRISGKKGRTTNLWTRLRALGQAPEERVEEILAESDQERREKLRSQLFRDARNNTFGNNGK